MDFMLFTNDVVLASRAEAAGVGRIVIDLERRGKAQRQHGYHLECNGHTVSDLVRMKAAVSLPVLCRVNPIDRYAPQEIEAVIAAGADLVMLPMFREAREVASFLALVGGRARTSLLFETPEALSLASQLDPRSFDEVYVGLNDLAVAYGSRVCYELVAEGLVDRMRACFPDKPFGFGGVTVLDGGFPIPTRLILMEQARLGCTQTILRRAFKRDVAHRELPAEIRRLTSFYEACLRRSPQDVAADRRRFLDVIAAAGCDAAEAVVSAGGEAPSMR